MAWVKLDDQFTDHPKVVAAGPLAELLHLRAIIWCGRYLTDGFIPREMVGRLATFEDVRIVTSSNGQEDVVAGVSSRTLADRLVEVGLWDAADGGYQVHDFLEYNPSRQEVEATRKERSEAGSRGGYQKASKVASKTPSESLANGWQKSGKTTSKSLAKSCPVPVPVPVPDPMPVEDTGGAPTRSGEGASWQDGKGNGEGHDDGYDPDDGEGGRLKPELRQALIHFGATQFQSAHQQTKYARLLTEVGSTRFLDATHWASCQGLALSKFDAVATAARNGRARGPT